MTRSIGVIIAGVASLLSVGSVERVRLHEAPVAVREVPVDSLRDVAMAVYSPTAPVIYYNPAVLQRLGPQLSAFFMAHEYGHIHLRHVRASALGRPRAGLDSMMQVRELEADCFAAATLGSTNRAAVDAAVRFFSRLGPVRFDNEHPTGAQRAANILACLPLPESPAARADHPAHRAALAEGPLSVRVLPLAPGTLGQDAHVWIDGRLAGTISNRRQPSSITVLGLPAGTHEYRLSVELYSLDDLMQFNPSGTVTGGGLITLEGEESFVVAWSQGQVPTLLPTR